MIPQSNLGRYECVDSSTNTKKYWHLMYDKTKGKYIAIWVMILMKMIMKLTIKKTNKKWNNKKRVNI